MGAVTSYFTDTYGTVYDTTMLQNALQTDLAETRDLLNAAFIMRIIGLQVLQVCLWLLLRWDYPTWGKGFDAPIGLDRGKSCADFTCLWWRSAVIMPVSFACISRCVAMSIRSAPIYSVG